MCNHNSPTVNDCSDLLIHPRACGNRAREQRQHLSDEWCKCVHIVHPTESFTKNFPKSLNMRNSTLWYAGEKHQN